MQYISSTNNTAWKLSKYGISLVEILENTDQKN